MAWLIGATILFLKGYYLLKEAYKISESLSIIIIVLFLSILAGSLKNKFIMSKFCRNNLVRISKIESPKVYQFFSQGFIFALVLMILTGVLLSRMANGDYSLLIAVGGLDLSLSVALFLSSTIFSSKKVK